MPEQKYAIPADRDACPRRQICRRTLLLSLIAGTTVCALPRIARPAKAIELPTKVSANRQFSVIYQGDKIGLHSVFFSAATGQTRVTTEIDLEVKLLFFSVFAFRHRSEEIWRDGRLVSLSSETFEDNETIRVIGEAMPQGFRVVSNAGPFIAASDALTSNSLWTQAILERDTVIDAQYGGIIGVSVHRLADEHITIAGRQIRTMRYAFITPYLAGSIWYDEAGRWVHGEFERDGAQFQYQLDV